MSNSTDTNRWDPKNNTGNVPVFFHDKTLNWAEVSPFFLPSPTPAVGTLLHNIETHYCLLLKILGKYTFSVNNFYSPSIPDIPCKTLLHSLLKQLILTEVSRTFIQHFTMTPSKPFFSINQTAFQGVNQFPLVYWNAFSIIISYQKTRRFQIWKKLTHNENNCALFAFKLSLRWKQRTLKKYSFCFGSTVYHKYTWWVEQNGFYAKAATVRKWARRMLLFWH